MAAKEEEEALPLEPEDQRKFDTILRTVNALVCESSLLEAANKNVTRLGLKRVLPEHISFVKLLSKLENLQVSVVCFCVLLQCEKVKNQTSVSAFVYV